MRVAVLIQGEPRFCREFDLFLDRLKGYDEVDYFFCLWETSQPVSDYWRTRQSVLVAEPWANIDKSWALKKLQNNLPCNHHVTSLKLVDQNSLTFPEVLNVGVGVNSANLWKMMYSLYMVNDLKKDYELTHKFKYDLVIRARPDVMLHDYLDLTKIKERIDNNSSLVALPNNTRCGMPIPISDIMAISSSENMDAYCNLYNRVQEYLSKGVDFHPETLLSHHLSQYNINFSEYFDYLVDIRHLGEKLGGEQYISDFGRWGK